MMPQRSRRRRAWTGAPTQAQTERNRRKISRSQRLNDAGVSEASNGEQWEGARTVGRDQASIVALKNGGAEAVHATLSVCASRLRAPSHAAASLLATCVQTACVAPTFSSCWKSPHPLRWWHTLVLAVPVFAVQCVLAVALRACLRWRARPCWTPWAARRQRREKQRPPAQMKRRREWWPRQ